MNVETLAERRKREIVCFNEQQVFPEGCTSWKEFLSFCHKKEGEPFTLTLQRSVGETIKSIDEFYFFGVMHVATDALSFGKQCFTPLNFITRTATSIGSITQEDLALQPGSLHEGKILDISFDREIFWNKLLAKSLFFKGNLLTYPEYHMYVVMMLGYFSLLREALPHHRFQKFEDEIEKIEAKLQHVSNQKAVII